MEMKILSKNVILSGLFVYLMEGTFGGTTKRDREKKEMSEFCVKFMRIHYFRSHLIYSNINCVCVCVDCVG